MDVIKNELIEYSNNRSELVKFSDYDDYINSQVIQGMSHEKNSDTWRNGQRRCIQEKFLNINRDQKILDICCGDGIGLQKLKEMGFNNIWGAEICDEKIKFAKEFATVIKTDICLGPFEFNQTFDIIYSSHSLEHVLNPFYTIKNIAKFLNDDGIFIIVLPYIDLNGADPNKEHFFRVHCGTVPLGLHINDNGNTLCNNLENMGFKIINKSFANYREPEIHLILKKYKIEE